MDKQLNNIMDTISGLLPGGCDAYIVGGTVRDMLMGRASADVDVAVSSGAGALSRGLARRLGGSAFVMDKERDVHRVALKSGPVSQVDVSPLRGDIHHDLSARDFTVNAMALKISAGMGQGSGAGEVIDPFGGLADIKAGSIRALGRAAFTDDPLRMMRAFRLAAALGFDIEPETFSMVRDLAGGISGVSPERVRDELYMILAAKGAEDTLCRMHAQGLLFAVLPELIPMEGLEQGEPHAYDLLEHSLRTVGHSEAVMSGLAQYFGENAAKVDEYLKLTADGGADMGAAVKLCALLHDSGKPSTMKVEGGRPRFFGHAESGALINERIARRLRLSERARRALSRTAALHMRPLNLSRDVPPSRRAVHRLVREAGDDLPALAVVALSDALATREKTDEPVTDVEGAVRLISDYYYGDYMAAVIKPLLKGGDLIAEFGLAPGPAIGRILVDVEEKRAEGLISDKDGALAYVRENIESYIG